MKLDLQPMIRFLGHLPKNGDTELSLLKCHLLIEEVLTKLIVKAAKHPEYVQKARLTFAQKSLIARSMSDLERETWLWGALKKLNDARNELAHGLSLEEIRSRLDDFIRFVEAEKGAPETDSIGPTFGAFHWAAFRVFTILSTYAHFDPTQVGLGIATRTLLGGDAEPRITPDPPSAAR